MCDPSSSIKHRLRVEELCSLPGDDLLSWQLSDQHLIYVNPTSQSFQTTHLHLSLAEKETKAYIQNIIPIQNSQKIIQRCLHNML